MQAGAGRRRRIPRDAIEAEGRGGSIDAAEGGSVPAGSGGMGTFPPGGPPANEITLPTENAGLFGSLAGRSCSSIGLDGKPKVKATD